MDARYRSSDSPERSEPPTLPHRSQDGSPSFKPVPPPSNGVRVMHLVDCHKVSSESGSGSDPLQRRFPPSKTSGGERATAPHTEQIPQLKKPPSRAPSRAPSEAADNELMAKLHHRKNKMREAKQAPLPARKPASHAEENKDEERKPPELQRPPPPSKRIVMTPQLSQPSTQPTVIQTPLPVVEKASETSTVPTPTTTTSAPAPTSVKPRGPKAPPPKLKEPDPEWTPQQQELAARKARLADHVKEEEKKEEEEQKRKNDTPSKGPPPIAPKYKRKDPVPRPPSSHPSPPKPPCSQLLPSKLPPSQPPPSHLPPSQVSSSHLPTSQLLSSQPALSASTEEPGLVAGLHRKQPPEADTDFAAVLQQSLLPPISSHEKLKHLTAEMQPVPTSGLHPQLPPKNGRKHHLNAPPPTFEGDDASDGPAGPATWKKDSVEDITSALNDGSLLIHEVATGGEGAKTGPVPEQGGNEFNQLAAPLHCFDLESDNTPDQSGPEPDQPESKPDQPEAEPDQPDPEPDQPDPEPDQPESKPDELEPEPDQPEPDPDQPEPDPDQPEPEPDQPEPDQPEPEPDQPESESDQPESAPDKLETLETDTDQLLADIDSMLADITTHLDTMIP